MKDNKATSIFMIAFYSFFLIGYAMNVYKLCKSDFEPSYKREIIYGIGTVTGLGAIIGWFNIEDTPSISNQQK